MNATTKTMTLADFANQNENVVLFWAGNGCPAGSYWIVNDSDFFVPDGIEDMEGEVDAAGEWHWNGEGEPRDVNGNSIYTMHGYVDAAKYAELAEAE